MGPAEALGHVQCAAEPDVRAVERLLVAALAVPHPEADLHGLLEDLEPLAEGRVGEPEPDGLFLVVARADAEHHPPAGEDVERRDHLGEQAGRPVRGGGRQREQADALGVRGDEAERRVRLDLALEVAAEVVALPDVVGDVDRVEAGRLGGLDDVLEVRPKRRGAAAPRRLGDVQPELHGISRCVRPALVRAGCGRAAPGPETCISRVSALGSNGSQPVHRRSPSWAVIEPRRILENDQHRPRARRRSTVALGPRRTRPRRSTRSSSSSAPRATPQSWPRLPARPSSCSGTARSSMRS